MNLHRLWVKLSLAFLAISLAAIGVVAVLSARATREQFRQYVVASGMAGQIGLGADPDGILRGAGKLGWRGSAAGAAWPGRHGDGLGTDRCRRAGAGPNFAVADPAGRVLASKTGELVGEVLPASVLAQGIADDAGWPRHRDLVECAAGRCGF